MGRTGAWFGYQHYGIEPDFVTMAKGLASGYAAISCTVTTEAIFDLFKDAPEDALSYFRDVSTFGGCTAGPVAALECLKIMEREDLLANTNAMGARLELGLMQLMDKHQVIGDLRGRGLFYGLELVADRVSKEPLAEKLAQSIGAECAAQGVLVSVTNRSMPGFNNTLVIAPPLIASASDIDQIVEAVDIAMARVVDRR